MIERLPNRRIYDQTTAARDALDKLDALGCEVVDIQLGGHKPVITIVADRAAAALDGATCRLETIRGSRIRTMVCPLAGCVVRWTAAVITDTGVFPPDRAGAMRRFGEGLA